MMSFYMEINLLIKEMQNIYNLMCRDVKIHHKNVLQKKIIKVSFQTYLLLQKFISYKWILINTLLNLYLKNKK